MVSPAEHDLEGGFVPDENLDQGFDLEAALAWDLHQVCAKVDGVAVLPGWEQSLGTRAEVATALALGKPVRTVDDLLQVTDDGPITSEQALSSDVNLYDLTRAYAKGGPVVATDLADPFGMNAILDREILNGTATSGRWGLTPSVERVTSATGGEKEKKLAELGCQDPLALLKLAEVSGYGARKYAAFNYLKGYDWSLTFNALQRHLLAFWNGEETDPESGLPHAAHAAWHCLALVSFSERGIGTDDRFKGA